MENTEIEIDLGRIMKQLMRKSWVILISAMVLLAVSFVFISDTKGVKSYKANSTIYSVSNGSYREAMEGTNAMKDYAEIILTLKVCERAAIILGDDAIDGYYILDSISPYYSKDSSILTIQAYDSVPENAVKIANAVANAFVIEMRTITGGENVQLLDEAYTYELISDGGKDILMKRIMFAGIGIVIACAYIALKEIFTSRLQTIRECTLGGELDVIGVIPVYKN